MKINTNVKLLIWISFVLLTFPINILAADKMTCAGDIGNAYLVGKSEYRTFGRKTVDFSIDCGMVDRYLKGQKNCQSYLNNVPTGGYFSEDVWQMLKPMGQYNPKTKFLTFKLSEGYMNPSIFDSLNQTQRWFNGYCRG